MWIGHAKNLKIPQTLYLCVFSTKRKIRNVVQSNKTVQYFGFTPFGAADRNRTGTMLPSRDFLTTLSYLSHLQQEQVPADVVVRTMPSPYQSTD